MTRSSHLSCIFKTIAFAAIVLAAGTARAQPPFPGFEYEATGTYIDNDNDGVISCGDDVEFMARIGINQGAPFPVLDGEFGATGLDNGIVLVGSVTAVSHHPAGGPIVVTEGNSSGDVNVAIDLGVVCPPDTCPEVDGDPFGTTVTFFMRIREPNIRQFLTVPGFARGSNYAQSSNQPGYAYERCDPPPGPGEVDLFVDKDDGGVTAPSGSVVAYDIAYGNDGSLRATGVVLTETVPSHAFFDAAGSATGWSCADGAPAGTVCSLPAGNLPAGSATSTTFAVRIASTLPAGVHQTSNTVTIADDGANGPDDNPADNTSTDTTPIGAAPDLAVAKDDGGVSTSPAAVVAYDLDYGNLGTQGSTGVVLRETVPDHAAFEAAGSSPGWSCANGAPAGTLCTRALGPLAVGETGSATFAVRVAPALPPGTGQIVNTVTIVDDDANGPDPDPSNNTASDSTPIAGAAPDLFVVKDDGGATTEAGGTVVYALAFGNAGSRGASRVELTDAVPDHAIFDGAGSSPRWSCSDGDPAGTVCTVEIDSLLPGESDSLTFALRVSPTLPAGVDQLVNTATIADDGTNGPDLDPADNTSTDTTPVEAAPDLRVLKDDGGVTAGPGSTVVYALSYANAGTQDATGVAISDVVPAHALFDGDASSPGWSCTDGAPEGTECTLAVGPLASGDTATAAFAVQVVSPVPKGVDEIVNTATVADDGANGPDLDPSDNSSTDTTPVGGEAAPDLFVVKDDGGVAVEPGDLLVYDLAFGNRGGQGASAVEISDGVPRNTVFDADASSPGWSCSDGAPAGTPCTLALGVLGAGDVGSRVFAVRVLDELPPGVDELTNTATIADDGANGPDLNPADNTSTDTTPIGGPAPGPIALEAFKSDDPERLPADRGDAITYTVVIVNETDSTAAATVFESDAPAHTALVTGTVSTTHGTVLEGNGPGDEGVAVDLGDLAASEEAVVTFQVLIDQEVPAEVSEIVCQGTVTAEGLDPFPTDDPDTPVLDDPTRTPLVQPGGPAPVDIPTAGPFGLALLVALLAGLAIRRLSITSA